MYTEVNFPGFNKLLKSSNLYGSGGSGGEVVAGNVDVCDVDVWVE